MQSPVDTQVSPQDTQVSPLDGSTIQISLDRDIREEVLVQRPPPVADVPPRSETAFSQANTLVRSSSTRSRSSIAKLPIIDDEPSSSQQEQPLRSIFPTYNPEIPLYRQDYFPTQTSPTHIPRAVISRMTVYHPDPENEEEAQNPDHRSPVISPASGGSATQWPPRRPIYLEPPIIPTTCVTEELRSLWKVTNGWKASHSEGRVYCLKLTQEKDAPVYTLSSQTQPFYSLRLDPTSASAYVTLARHDPNKPYKPAVQPTSSTSSILSGVVGHGKAKEDKNWQEALTTTLEEESRKHPPNDGLVALLFPSAATKMALDRPDDMQVVMMAERECARLVWDDDSRSHFLVHPALATPFCITIERSPAWSRTEYTLEHHESPQHLAKLTRDGTGQGWLEVDTALAAKIESFFIIDVAVTALLLVAASDERHAKVETFEPPPVPTKVERRFSKMSRMSRKETKKAAKKGGSSKMEEFEMDLESQTSSFAKLDDIAKDKEKIPGVVRVLIKVLTAIFKCMIWCLTLAFRALGLVVRGLLRCVGAN
jgi:hypothetical protein